MATQILPGDAIETPEGRAVVDSHYFGQEVDDRRGPVVMAVVGASAYRGGPGLADMIELRITEGAAPPFVSCSGGPCPFVPLAELEYVGTTEQRFWRWKDRPRAGGGVDFVETVNLWRWLSPAADTREVTQ